MLYVLALICPPLALLLIGKPIAAILNGCFWLVGCVLVMAAGVGLLLVIPCVVHAWAAIGYKRNERRHRELLRAVKH